MVDTTKQRQARKLCLEVEVFFFSSLASTIKQLGQGLPRIES
jgi:hypothetical protein